MLCFALALAAGTVFIWNTTNAQTYPDNNHYNYDPIRGIMPPDMIMPGDIIIKHRTKSGAVITYSARRVSGNMWTVSTNGRSWVTISYKNGSYVITDPNGTSDPVILTVPAKSGPAVTIPSSSTR